MKKHMKALLPFLILGVSFVSVAEESSFKDFWKHAEIYDKNDTHVKFSGRLQADSVWVDADQGEYSDLSWRRFRFGVSGSHGKYAGALEADINLNKPLGEQYKRLTDAKISYKYSDKLKVTVLKQSTGFTLDGRTSSKKLLTPQRNNLTNNLWFTKEYFTGVSAKGSISDWSYNAGIFSSDDSDEIGFTEASYFTLLSASKKLASSTYWDKATLNFDYVYNDLHVDGNTKSLNAVYSFSSKFSKNNYGLSTDVSLGDGGFGQSNIFGFVVMPHYQMTEITQWVVRYTYLTSAKDNGLHLGRYDKDIVTDKGDKYHEIYGGFNFLFNSHKLKLHTGLQYAKMSDSAADGGKYGGLSFTVAVRSYW